MFSVFSVLPSSAKTMQFFFIMDPNLNPDFFKSCIVTFSTFTFSQIIRIEIQTGSNLVNATVDGIELEMNVIPDRKRRCRSETIR